MEEIRNLFLVLGYEWGHALDAMFSLAEASNSLSWQDIQRMPLPERKAYALRLENKLQRDREAIEKAKRR